MVHTPGELLIENTEDTPQAVLLGELGLSLAPSLTQTSLGAGAEGSAIGAGTVELSYEQLNQLAEADLLIVGYSSPDSPGGMGPQFAGQGQSVDSTPSEPLNFGYYRLPVPTGCQSARTPLVSEYNSLSSGVRSPAPAAVGAL